MTASAAWIPAVLAFRVWDGFGWAGQALFTWRIVEQWLHSERARRTVIPRGFWATSLLGSLFSFVYTAARREPVFMLGALVNGSIYGRNLWLSRAGAPEGRAARRAVWPLALGVLLFVAVSIEAIGPDHGLVRFDYRLPWLLVGFLGQALWSGRFVVQWYASERLGRSVLPPSFFWIGLVGAVLSFAYAVYRVDWVNMAAYALNPIPYARNLVLVARHRRAEAAAGPASRGPA